MKDETNSKLEATNKEGKIIEFNEALVKDHLAGMVLASGVHAVEPVRHSDPNMPGLPGQTDEWWAKLREEQRAAKKAAQQQEAVSEEGVCFYTGKPFDADLGYVFKYRNYNPEMQRWTTMDPSGFPDGANNYVYVASPIGLIDPLGLAAIEVTSSNIHINVFDLTQSTILDWIAE